MAKKKTEVKVKPFKITQSFMKDMDGYAAQEVCGNVIKSKWIDRNYPDIQSDSMALGAFFEYRATGMLPKSGNVPEGRYMKGKGPKDGDDALYADYRRAAAAATLFKSDLLAIGCKIVAAGYRKTRGAHEGTIDVKCEFTGIIGMEQVEEFILGSQTLKVGDQFILDLKFSGLMGERWSKFGWPLEPHLWTPDQIRYNGHQAKQYSYLEKGLPYFFYVAGASSANEGERVFFEITGLSEEVIESHVQTGIEMVSNLEVQNEIGFVPYPSFKRCNECPLKDNCIDKKMYPDVIQVNLGA